MRLQPVPLEDQEIRAEARTTNGEQPYVGSASADAVALSETQTRPLKRTLRGPDWNAAVVRVLCVTPYGPLAAAASAAILLTSIALVPLLAGCGGAPAPARRGHRPAGRGGWAVLWLAMALEEALPAWFAAGQFAATAGSRWA